MRAVATSPLTPASVLPFAATKMSPATIPALSAGEPSNTFATRRPLGSGATLTPTPVKLLFCDCWKRLYSAGVK